MPDITRGHSFVSGEVVEAQSLNDLVSNAVVQPTLISQKVLKDPAALSDRILIEDSGTLKGITIQQIIDLVTPSIVNSAIPLGTVCDYAGGGPPSNWMLCYGQAIDRDAFADLFAILGTGYGAGDGTTTFNLPDYRSCVLAGKSDMGGTSNGFLGSVISGVTLGAYAGAEQNLMSVNQMPVHSHSASSSVQAPMHAASAEGGGSQGLTNGGSFAGRVFVQAGYETGCQASTTIGTAGGSQPQNNLQPTKIVNKIIKVLNP